MSDRDPRVDPRPGDCLRGPRGGRRWVESVGDEWLRWHADDGRSRPCSLRGWQRWAASATVVRRAEEVVR